MSNCKARTKTGNLCGNIAVKGSKFCYLHVERSQVGFLRRLNNRITNHTFLAWVTIIGVVLGAFSVVPLFGWLHDLERPILEMAVQNGIPGHTQFTHGIVGQKTLVQFWIANVGRSPAYVTAVSQEAELGPDAEQKLKVQPWIAHTEQIYKNPLALTVPTTEPMMTDDDPGYEKPDAIAVWVRVRYHDFFHHEWESDVCFREAISRTLDFCQSRRHGVIDCEKEKCDAAF